METNDLTTKKTMDVVSFLKEYNTYLTLSGISKLTGINKDQLSQYIQGYRNPSPKTTQKIQERINAFGKELQLLEFD